MYVLDGQFTYTVRSVAFPLFLYYEHDRAD